MRTPSTIRTLAERLGVLCLTILFSTLISGPRPTSAAPATQPAKSSNAATIAVFKLDSAITESGGGGGDLSALFGKQPTTLRELVSRMRKAGEDPNVKAVVLLSEGGSYGSAQIEEMRQAIGVLQSAGKPVYAHSDSMMMGTYSLLSGVTRLSMVPTADLWVTGMFGEQPYIRGLLDKLGVKPDFIHCGAYKSYSEMFMREGPSPEADAMMNWLFDGIFEAHVNLIAKGRKVDPSKARQWIDEGPYIAEKAKEKGLIDAVEHREAFEAMLKEKHGADVVFDKKYGEPKEPEIDLSSPFALFKILGELMNGPQKKGPSKPAVGIVYVDGGIELGDGEGSSPLSGGQGAYSTKVRKALDEAANDDSIKAVVLRVDSPGGSAVASEIILEATKRVKAKKPFVVSMGNVAGSGGYYVSCASDLVFADESTITASIGVVGGKLATNDMWKKVGITFKGYQRGKAASLLSTAAPFTDEERARMQEWMDEIYGVFKAHVVAIRGNRLKKPIDDLAAGRVFTGKQALELGLVDRIGTMSDAIDYVASAAKLGSTSEYEIRSVPEQKNLIEKLFENAKGDSDPSHVAMKLFASRIGTSSGSLADLAMPYLQHLDPHRVSQIRAALRTLDLMQHDGVMLTSPQLMIWDNR